MDLFDNASKAALKGALVACGRGQWTGGSLKVTATTSGGDKLPIELNLEATSVDGDPAVKLSVPRPPAAAREPEELIEQAVHKDPMTGFYHRRRFLEVLTDRLDAGGSRGVRVLAYIRPGQVPRAGGADRAARERRRAGADRRAAPRAHSAARPLRPLRWADFHDVLGARHPARRPGVGAERAGTHRRPDLRKRPQHALRDLHDRPRRDRAEHGTARHAARGSAALEPARPRSRRQSGRAATDFGREHARSALRRDLGAADQGRAHGEPLQARAPADRELERRAPGHVRHGAAHDRRAGRRGHGRRVHAGRDAQSLDACDRPLGHRRELGVLHQDAARLRVHQAFIRVADRPNAARLARARPSEAPASRRGRSASKSARRTRRST